jgi:DMSO/TMAO reductase YedYZ heme-binding membrane subunit
MDCGALAVLLNGRRASVAAVAGYVFWRLTCCSGGFTRRGAMTANDVRNRVFPIILCNTPGQWLSSAAFCGAAFLFFWAYHDWWRAKPYSLGTADEALALAALMGLSVTLSLGPLCRLTGRFERALALRRPLALVAVCCAAAHIAVTLIFLSGKYGWNWITSEWLSFLLGLAAALLLGFLAAMSFPWALQRFGREGWRRAQQWSDVALGLVLLHFVVLGKFPKWLDWFAKLDQPAPPGTLPAFVVGALVLILRAIARLSRASAE